MERAAPGLNKTQRTKLRTKWINQNKPCAYCGQPADTLDHILPLVRGGTNYEGNLVPACRSCNSSKSARTIIEWRTGKQPRTLRDLPDWIGKPPRAKKPKPPRKQRDPHDCPICQRTTMNPVYCSPECRIERARRDNRNVYRAAHGLAVDRDRPVKTRAPARF